MSIAWIDVTSSVLIDVLYFIVFATGIHYSFIGLSLLALGNSIGTYYANTTLAHYNYGTTSITGCFAEPIFNIVFGFGIALFLRAYKGE
jgi:sodium/potassium/calcium exchanger 6